MYKSIVEYLTGQGDPSGYDWQQKISRLLESYPFLANEEDDEVDEDSQDMVHKLCENAPEEALFSPSSSEEEEEEEGVGVAKSEGHRRRSTRNAAVSSRSKVSLCCAKCIFEVPWGWGKGCSPRKKCQECLRCLFQ